MTDDNPFEGHPEQPPGVDGDDPKSLPGAADAATRVLRYVEALGDGLYDVIPLRDGPVLLYGRDLEVVARAARDSVKAREIRTRLEHHLRPNTDPCQDRGCGWPCDVAEAFGYVEPWDGS